MFPNRAIIIAPVARDLSPDAEGARTNGSAPKGCVRIPGANNGIKQGWDTLDQDYFAALADGTLSIYGTIASIPLALKKYLVQFKRYDTSAANTGAKWKRWQDCTAADFIKTNNGVKAVTALIVGDVPSEWYPMHEWAGKPADTLGAP